ncbi:hypothetical protein ACF3M2_20830 [Tissierella carlieri]
MNKYTNTNSILKDISMSKLEKRKQNGWRYPDNILERIKLLKLNWISYEDILEREFNLSDLDVTKDKWEENEGIVSKLNEIIKNMFAQGCTKNQNKLYRSESYEG